MGDILAGGWALSVDFLLIVEILAVTCTHVDCFLSFTRVLTRGSNGILLCVPVHAVIKRGGPGTTMMERQSFQKTSKYNIGGFYFSLVDVSSLSYSRTFSLVLIYFIDVLPFVCLSAGGDMQIKYGILRAASSSPVVIGPLSLDWNFSGMRQQPSSPHCLLACRTLSCCVWT